MIILGRMGLGYLNANNSVSFIPTGFNENSNEIYWLWISDYISISMNLLERFIHSKITLFGGKNLGQSYWTNFPLAESIHIWLLFLNTIESPAQSRLFKNIRNFRENMHSCQISLKKF